MDEIAKANPKIENLIYEIRGQQVMLDSDLAMLYEVETKQLNRQVKRNIERFDEDFCFQLTGMEYENLRCQIGTAKSEDHSNNKRRTLPYVFTEMGVSAVASVLHSDIAVRMSKDIIRAFVLMRHYIGNNLISQKYYNEMTIRHDSEIKLLQTSFQKFEEKRKDSMIFFNGQFFDAYSKICDIFKEAKENLIIIDSYSDRETLKIIKNLTIPVVIITSNKSSLSNQDIKKYNAQYNNLKVIKNDTFHDRYFILDSKTVYCCGTSLNYLGRKTFSVIKVSDDVITNLLKEKIVDILNK